MESLNPQDLLLAYNGDFTGYTSLGSMPQPLEHRGSLRPEGVVLGGTVTSDGYYEDFTASLARFVKDYPRLAAPQARPKTGGTAAEARPLNWGAMIITFSAPDDSDDERGDDERGDDERDDERGDDERGDGERGDDNDERDDDERGDGERGDDERGDDKRGGMTGGAHHRGPLVPLGDFIVDGEYLGGVGDEIGAEMDETDAETDPFERSRFGLRPATPEAKASSAHGSDPMDGSILGFVFDK